MESELNQDHPVVASVRPVTRLLRFGLASITALVLTGIMLGVSYAAGMLQGAHMWVVIVALRFSVPFALAVGIVAAAFPRTRSPGRRTALLAAAAGAAVGCLCWYSSEIWIGMQWSPGEWHWNFHWEYLPQDYMLQAASCWIIAGASAMLVTFTRRTPTVLIAAASLCLLAVLPALLFNSIHHNRELTVAIVLPASPGVLAARPSFVIGSGPHMIHGDAEVAALTAHVLQVLRSSGVPGEYRVTQLIRCGTGKKSLQIIVVSAPIASHALLPVPDGTEIIYLQKPGGWQSIPERAPTLNRSVNVREPSEGRRRVNALGSYCVPDVNGNSPCPEIRRE